MIRDFKALSPQVRITTAVLAAVLVTSLLVVQEVRLSQLSEKARSSAFQLKQAERYLDDVLGSALPDFEVTAKVLAQGSQGWPESWWVVTVADSTGAEVELCGLPYARSRLGNSVEHQLQVGDLFAVDGSDYYYRLLTDDTAAGEVLYGGWEHSFALSPCDPGGAE